MAEVNIETYHPEPKQQIFHGAPQRNKLYGGSMGGGKTRTLCEEMNMLMIEFPGNRGLILRKTFADFRLSTYLILVEKTLSQLISANLVKERKDRKVFEYWNGSTLFYGGLDTTSKEKEKYFSSEFGAIAIDEAREITEEEFGKLGTRLRHRLPSGKFPRFHMLLASNPAQNWLKTRFILSPDTEKDIFVPALPSENPHNPPDYIAQLRDLFSGDEKMIAAYVEGSWDAVGGIDDLLMMSDIEPCIEYPIVRDFHPRRATVCDFARFGDDMTVIYDFVEAGSVASESYGKKDTGETVGRILYHREKNSSSLVGIDPIGEGAGAYDSLMELSREYRGNTKFEVIGIDFRGKSSKPRRFKNLRAEIYWTGREKIKNRQCSIPDDPQLHGQLCSVKYKFVPGAEGMKIQIESKENIKKRLSVSPDKADSYMMGLYAIDRTNPSMDLGFSQSELAEQYEEERRREIREWATA